MLSLWCVVVLVGRVGPLDLVDPVDLDSLVAVERHIVQVLTVLVVFIVSV